MGIVSFFNTAKEAFLQWVTDRRIRKSLLTEWIPSVKERLAQASNSVFLVLTPEHGNLGDHAIASAEDKLLKELGIPHIEVTEAQLWKLQKNGLLSVMNGHPIFINGGGNLGTLWIGVEIIQREIIRNNPNSPIVILPNTIFYEDSDYGKEEFQKSIELYNAHQELYLYAREKQSYEVMESAYRHVKLMPDMVLSLNKTKHITERSGCILCLREDCEKTRNDEQDAIILSQVEMLFGENYRYSDMRLAYKVSPDKREYELEEKFDEFRRAELVITDRLHGMIFCAITGTPCIVIDSKSPKVRGCYEWVVDLEYITMVQHVKDIAQAYAAFTKRQYNFDEKIFSDKFLELKEDIECICSKRGEW